ncbi:MAG: carbohydrate ABC transporter permease [Anaerolineae bacterium]|nr:carbohydrate ABC transporter permease [Anaerolineae bacterium]
MGTQAQDIPTAKSQRSVSKLGIDPKLQRALLVKLPVFLALCLVALTTLLPLGYMGMTALKTRTEYLTNPFGLPQSFYLDNFRVMIENYGFLRSFGNSVLIVGSALFLSLLIGSLAAFAVAKLRFRGKRVFFLFLISLQLIPGQVLLIPIYLLFSRLGMINNYLSVIFMYMVGSLPFSIFFLSASFRNMPDELMEAARIDGASFREVFQHIILPMGRPAILTLGILNFLSMWNELILALMLLPDENKRTITASVSMVIGRFTTNQPLLMTGLLMSSLPTVVVLVMFSNYLVKGISAGIGK